MRLRRELHGLIVRRAKLADRPAWAAMLARLHPEQSAAEFEAEFADLPEHFVAFLAFTDAGEPIAMIDAMVRNYAEGAPNFRAAYVEDLWVEPEHRRGGVARALLQAVEQWADEQGLSWLGSDAAIGNTASHAWHASAGFDEIERIVVFGKPLR
ncbi:MAG: GNAT family N-acetyltransferase [Sphingomicrobium sp.]